MLKGFTTPVLVFAVLMLSAIACSPDPTPTPTATPAPTPTHTPAAPSVYDELAAEVGAPIADCIVKVLGGIEAAQATFDEKSLASTGLIVSATLRCDAEAVPGEPGG